MPGASPQSHDASRWGSSKMGTSPRWHHARAPHLSQFLNPPPSPPTQLVDNRPPYPRVEDSLKKVNKNVYPEVSTGILTLPLWHTPQVVRAGVPLGRMQPPQWLHPPFGLVQNVFLHCSHTLRLITAKMNGRFCGMRRRRKRSTISWGSPYLS